MNFLRNQFKSKLKATRMNKLFSDNSFLTKQMLLFSHLLVLGKFKMHVNHMLNRKAKESDDCRKYTVKQKYTVTYDHGKEHDSKLNGC